MDLLNYDKEHINKRYSIRISADYVIIILKVGVGDGK